MSKTRSAHAGLVRLLPLAFVLLGVLAAPAQASFPGQNGKIAFVRESPNPAPCNGQSPENATLLHAMNADGTGEAPLGACGVERPRWSPDGRWLAYYWPCNGCGVMISRPDGSDPAEGHPGSEFYVGMNWSADATRLILSDACPGFPCEPDGWSKVQSVPSRGGPCSNCVTFGFDDGSPYHFKDGDWSPDNKKVAYTEGSQVTTANATGGGQLTLTPAAVTASEPSWSPDGRRIAFSRIVPGGSLDIYVMNADGTGQTPVTIDPANDSNPVWSPDGTKIAFDSDRSGNRDIYVVNADGSGITRLTNDPAPEYQPDWQPIPRNYVRPKGATPIMVSLVPAFEECTATNGSHPAPWAFSSCTPAEHMSDYLTVGTPDVPGNGQPAKFIGTVRFDVCPVPGCAAPNVKLYASLTDVRKKDLSDYGGELQASVKVRLTGRPQGSAGTDGATVQDFALTFAVPCAPTTDTTVGSTCSVDTTQNSLVPGSVQSGKRAVWKLGEVNIYDGGADGDADTPGNTLFAWQGLFIP